MGKRRIIVKKSAAESIAQVAWFIESKGLVVTAEKYVDLIYDFIDKLADTKKSFPYCRDQARKQFGYKCITFKRKYSVVFIESETEIIVCEFIPSKLIFW